MPREREIPQYTVEVLRQAFLRLRLEIEKTKDLWKILTKHSWVPDGTSLPPSIGNGMGWKWCPRRKMYAAV